MRAPAATHSRASCPEDPENRRGPTQARRRPSQPSPLFGYTITGLPVWATAKAMAGNTSSGAQQLTPTATISGTPAATANASVSGCPARVRVPLIV
ncbi:Uncharacterised protein [Mycobacterium tuberculosis]|nr:Uncharacterised protein [Mycobacterium tuberculosis]